MCTDCNYVMIETRNAFRSKNRLYKVWRILYPKVEVTKFDVKDSNDSCCRPILKGLHKV